MFGGAARQTGLLFGSAKLAACSFSNFCYVKATVCLLLLLPVTHSFYIFSFCLFLISTIYYLLQIAYLTKYWQ